MNGKVCHDPYHSGELAALGDLRSLSPARPAADFRPLDRKNYKSVSLLLTSLCCFCKMIDWKKNLSIVPTAERSLCCFIRSHNSTRERRIAMKTVRWSLMVLAGLLLAWAVPAMAADMLEDPSHQIRAVQARGTILEMKVLDSRGAPVSGVRITAMGSDQNMREVVTNARGEAILDGLPNRSTGTVHGNKAHRKNVNWTFELESGMINKCIVHTIRSSTRCTTTATA